MLTHRPSVSAETPSSVTMSREMPAEPRRRRPVGLARVRVLVASRPVHQSFVVAGGRDHEASLDRCGESASHVFGGCCRSHLRCGLLADESMAEQLVVTQTRQFAALCARGVGGSRRCGLLPGSVHLLVGWAELGEVPHLVHERRAHIVVVRPVAIGTEVEECVIGGERLVARLDRVHQAEVMAEVLPKALADHADCHHQGHRSYAQPCPGIFRPVVTGA